jgi:hypothetical protein
MSGGGEVISPKGAYIRVLKSLIRWGAPSVPTPQDDDGGPNIITGNP